MPEVTKDQQLPDDFLKLLSDIVEQGNNKDFSRGYRHGISLGKQTVLLEHLQDRFGQMPDGVVAAVIATTESAELDRMLHSVATMSRLEDVFEQQYIHCPAPIATPDAVSLAMERFFRRTHLPSIAPQWPPFILDGIRYDLFTLSNSELYNFQSAMVHVEMSDQEMSLWEFNLRNAIFNSLPLCHFLLHRLAGDTRFCDDWKCSFAYPFLLHFIKGGEDYFYILRIVGCRDAPTLHLSKLVDNSVLAKSRGIHPSAFPELTDANIHALFEALINFVFSMVEVMGPKLKAPLFASVRADLRAYGCHNGRVFQIELQDEKGWYNYCSDWQEKTPPYLWSDCLKSLRKSESHSLTKGRFEGFKHGRELAERIFKLYPN